MHTAHTATSQADTPNAPSTNRSEVIRPTSPNLILSSSFRGEGVRVDEKETEPPEETQPDQSLQNQDGDSKTRTTSFQDSYAALSSSRVD